MGALSWGWFQRARDQTRETKTSPGMEITRSTDAGTIFPGARGQVHDFPAAGDRRDDCATLFANGMR